MVDYKIKDLTEDRDYILNDMPAVEFAEITCSESNPSYTSIPFQLNDADKTEITNKFNSSKLYRIFCLYLDQSDTGNPDYDDVNDEISSESDYNALKSTSHTFWEDDEEYDEETGTYSYPEHDAFFAKFPTYSSWVSDKSSYQKTDLINELSLDYPYSSIVASNLKTNKDGIVYVIVSWTV